VSAEKSADNVYTATLQSPETCLKMRQGNMWIKFSRLSIWKMTVLTLSFQSGLLLRGETLDYGSEKRKTLADMSYQFDVVKSLMGR